MRTPFPGRWLLVAFTASVALPAHGGPRDVVWCCSAGCFGPPSPISLAITAVALPAGEPSAAATEVGDVVRADLGASAEFDLQAPEGDPALAVGIEPDAVDLEPWRSLGTGVLVALRVWPAGHATCDPGGTKLCADAYVYDVHSGDKLASKRLRGDIDATRHLGHGIANTVLGAVTGIPGSFGTPIAAVGRDGEIHVVDSDGQNARPVSATGPGNRSPSWSADGRFLAWESRRGLYLEETATGRTRVLSSSTGASSPALSPDGTLLAVAVADEGDTDLVLLDVATGAEVRTLTDDRRVDADPVFAPDGERILFASAGPDGTHIFSVALDGSDRRQLTHEGTHNTEPAVSPDGERFAFVARTGRHLDVYVADINGSDPYRVTRDQGDNTSPSFSHDGRLLVIASTRSGTSELFLVTSDGRRQTRITTTGGWTRPTWMPAPPRRDPIHPAQ
jgi:TolB protein